MRAIVPFKVHAVTPAAPARSKDALTVVPDRSVSAALDDIATAPATARKKASQ